MNWFVELPADVTTQITVLVAVVVGFSVAKLATFIPWLGELLGAWREPIANALALAVIAALQNALPGEYPALSILAVKLVLELLTLFAVFNVLKRKGFRLFR